MDDNPITFPLDGRSLYVDATHEVVAVNSNSVFFPYHPLEHPLTAVLPVLTALNLSTLAATGPLPYDHIPKKRSFIAHELAPFATNVQFQREVVPL